MITYFLGIDPGNSGGLACVHADGHLCLASPMPDTERDIYDWIDQWPQCETRAVLEAVHAFPGQGVTSMFTFGQSYGSLRMALVASGIPWDTVSPQKWQEVFGLKTPKAAKLTQTQKKNANKAKAQQLFPGVRIIHATADALLLAEYARRNQ